MSTLGRTELSELCPGACPDTREESRGALPRNREELFNSLTHGLGLTLSLAGAPVLIVLAALRGSGWHVFSVSVYGASLVLLYACSTLYHSFSAPQWKQVFKVADHSAIYILIAGTYTPFSLINLHGGWGWTLFITVWILSLVGISLKLLCVDRFPAISIVLYIAMGWLALVAIRPMWHAFPPAGLAWIFAGGLFYTGGMAFFGWKRCPYNHAIWHMFVLAGSVCHYVAVMFYVLPARVTA